MDADFGLFAWLSLALWSCLIVMLFYDNWHYKIATHKGNLFNNNVAKRDNILHLFTH